MYIDIFSEGREAYWDGLSPRHNPYTFDIRKAEDWLDGWYDAEKGDFWMQDRNESE